MQRVLSVFVFTAVIGLASASMVRADGFLSPFAGVNLANNSGDGHSNLGADIGVMGAGIIGGELDLGYYPNFFGSQGLFGSNSVADVMGNLIIGVPAGGTHGPGVRPYAVAGLGLLRSKTTRPTGPAQSNNVGFGQFHFIRASIGVVFRP